MVATIQGFKYYSQSGTRYEFDIDKAVAALIGHPLLFWIDAPGTRLELLPGEPELLVKARAGNVTITMQPPVPDGADDVCVTKETPTRLRVVRITAEHRRIGAIVGDGLVVPLHAEKQVLKAISAISSIVTVQSDIGGSAADIDQVEADPRLHVHLLPYQQGLKMQVLVRPLPGAGAYYPPGSGAESVIADVNGARVEARRDLNAEREAERQLIGACHSLEHAEAEHGEWLLGQPVPCLELLTELQELDPAKVLVAWPEGESFRVSKKVDSKSVRLTIKRDKDWFAANGEVQIDETRIMDLRALLDMLRSSQGRFVALGDNQFMALSSRTAPAPDGAVVVRRQPRRRRARASAGQLRAGRTGARRRRRQGRQAVEGPPQAAGREHRLHAAAAEHLAGRAARLPAGRLRVAGAPRALGRRRLPGRRHGPRQNRAGAGADAGARAARADAGDRADLGVHELDRRSGKIRADAEGQAVRRRRPRRACSTASNRSTW